MSKVFFRNALRAGRQRRLGFDLRTEIFIVHAGRFTQIINSSMTFYVAEAACKTFLPDRFNNKEKLEIDGANALT